MASSSSEQKTPKPSKSILRPEGFCASAKKKVVRICEEFNRTLFITPRQLLRRSKRNKEAQKDDEQVEIARQEEEVSNSALSDDYQNMNIPKVRLSPTLIKQPIFRMIRS